MVHWDRTANKNTMKLPCFLKIDKRPSDLYSKHIPARIYTNRTHSNIYQCHCAIVFAECSIRLPFIFSLNIFNPLKSNETILAPTEGIIQQVFSESGTVVVLHLMAPLHTFPKCIAKSCIYMNQIV